MKALNNVMVPIMKWKKNWSIKWICYFFKVIKQIAKHSTQVTAKEREKLRNCNEGSHKE